MLLKKLIFTFKIVLIFSTLAYSQKYTIKLATIAPDGSTWMNVMEEFNQEVRKETNNEVGFNIYGGGVLGDEKDVLRKIRIGQLHAGGFTGFGMGEIVSAVRILDAPFLFKNYEEVDFIYEKLSPLFEEDFSKKGYELLGWAEVGFVYVFTKEAAITIDEMKKTKMWVWQGDLVAEATFKAFGLHPIPLSIIDVMTALQTNMVNGVYSSPLGAVALQWFTKVNYMMEVPMANASGAVLISKKMFNKIPEQHRRILKTLAKKYMNKLTQLSRDDNEAAKETLKKNGVKFLPAPDQTTLESYYQVGASARKSLVGKLFSEELLQEVESSLEEFRKSK